MTAPSYDPDLHILLRDVAHRRRIHEEEEVAEYLRRVAEPSDDLQEPGSRMQIFEVEIPDWPPAPRSPLAFIFGGDDPFADKPWSGLQPAVNRDWWTDRATFMIARRMVPDDRDFDPERLAYQWQVPQFDQDHHVIARRWCEANGVDLVVFLRDGAKQAGLDVFDATNPDVREELKAGSYSPTRMCFRRADLPLARRAAGIDPVQPDPAPDVAPDRSLPAGTLTRFVLVDAETGHDLRTIADGDAFVAAPRGLYGIRAEVKAGADVGSVVLSLSGPGADDAHERTENLAPYSLYGDARGREHGRPLPPGRFTLTATAWSGRRAAGRPIGTLTATFAVGDSAARASEPGDAPEPPPAPDVDGVREISSDEAVVAIQAALGRRFRLFGGQTADRRILAMRRDALIAWLAQDPTSRAVYVDEKRGRNYDCDDFAMELKAALARTAGLNGCAIVWGDAHAWCVFLVVDGAGAVEAVMVEPQTDAIVPRAAGEYAVARRCEVYL